MKLWYTNNSRFTSYTTLTPHSDSWSDFSSYITSHVQYTYHIAGNFWGINFVNYQHTQSGKKNFVTFIFATRYRCLTTPPTISRKEMVILSMYFNVETIARCYHAYQNVYRSLSVRNCHDKGGGANTENVSAVVVTTSELIVGCKNFPQFAWCFYDKNRSIFCRFTGSVARRHCAGLVSTKFLEKKFLL